MIASKQVVIIGCGLAGVTTALALHRFSVERGVAPPIITILERADGPEAMNRQNYSISLRRDVPGLQSLERIGMLEKVTALRTPAGGSFTIATHNALRWITLMQFNPPPNEQGMRVLRVDLWRCLLNELPDSIRVEWGVTAINIDESPLDSPAATATAASIDAKSTPTTLRVHLRDGRAITADVVVVADGSRSIIRTAMFGDNERLNFLNTVAICGVARSNKLHESTDTNITSLVPSGPTLLMSRGTSMFITPENERDVLWAISFPANTPRPRISSSSSSSSSSTSSSTSTTDADDKNNDHNLGDAAKLLTTDDNDEHRVLVIDDNISNTAGEPLRTEALQRGAAIPEPFATLVRNTPTEDLRVINFFDKMPNRSLRSGTVIFIGDACHAVSPYSGAGANMAFIDAVSLADRLTATSASNIATAVAAFDDEMVRRSSRIVRDQRRLIATANSTSRVRCALRNLSFRAIGFMVNHPRITKLTAATVITGVVVASAAAVYTYCTSRS